MAPAEAGPLRVAEEQASARRSLEMINTQVSGGRGPRIAGSPVALEAVFGDLVEFSVLFAENSTKYENSPRSYVRFASIAGIVPATQLLRRRPAADRLRWLATATRLVVGIGRYSHAFLGEIIDVSESRLVRRYHLTHLKTGVLTSRNGR